MVPLSPPSLHIQFSSESCKLYFQSPISPAIGTLPSLLPWLLQQPPNRSETFYPSLSSNHEPFSLKCQIMSRFLKPSDNVTANPYLGLKGSAGARPATSSRTTLTLVLSVPATWPSRVLPHNPSRPLLSPLESSFPSFPVFSDLRKIWPPLYSLTPFRVALPPSSTTSPGSIVFGGHLSLAGIFLIYFFNFLQDLDTKARSKASSCGPRELRRWFSLS